MATADAGYNPPLSGDFASTRQTYVTKAVALTGLTDYGVVWEDFAGTIDPAPGWASTKTGTGFIAAVATAGRSSSVQLGTGSTASSVGSLDTVACRLCNTSASTAKWYVGWRGSIPTWTGASTAAAGCGIAITTKASSILIGAYKNNANFGVQYDGQLETSGSFLDLGTVLDTAVHAFEIWHPGDGKVYARLDGGAVVSVTMSSAPANVAAICYAANGGTAADQRMNVDWYLAVFQRT